VLGSLSLFKDGWGGNHNIKIGGEVFHETVEDIFKDGFEEDILHVMQNGAKLDVILFETPNSSIGGLRTYGTFVNDTWRVNNKVTLNVGGRFDRYRAFAPAQEHPAGKFNPTPIQFAAKDNIVDWNLFAPRLGLTYDIRENGKTVIKFNYGKYWFNPGADFVFNVSENSSSWWRRYRWSDVNNNGRWDAGEEGALVDRRGGVATESLDPDLQNQRTDEVATFLERELMPNFGIRAGYVWRGVRNQYQRVNINRPYEAFTVPVSVSDPGPDGRVGTADDGTPLSAFDLAQAFRGLPVVNMTRNVEGGGADYHTIEITGTKRMSNRWSLLASWGVTKSFDNGSSAFLGNSVRANGLPATPNDKINTNDGRFEYTRHNAKLAGTLQTPWWRIAISPMLRFQQGFPFGRTFQSNLSFGSVRFLAEPLGTRHQDHIIITDVRVEKEVLLGGGRDLSAFFDIYNLFNSNPAQNLQWSSGTAFNRPLSIVPPRLARIGVKFNF
jgi:hypothetical protein